MLKELKSEKELHFILNKNSEKLILVEFSKNGCIWCQRLQPILEEFSKEQKNVIILKIDVEQFPKLAQDSFFRIKWVPMLFLFFRNEMKKKILGSRLNKENLQNFCNLD